jgi:signal transduction histidine kinase/ActR/RegA family two-component response regulator
MNLDVVANSYVARSSLPTRLTASQLEDHPDFGMVRELENREIPPVRGLLAAPLIGREGRTMGVIYVSDKTGGEFNTDDEAILVQLTQMAAVAVENILSAEAREANRAKDQFIAVLSHELRTPLTPVLATIASMQADKRLSSELQDDLKVIRRNVELEARLIDDLLDLTRISKGKIELQLEVVDANEILREAAGICRTDIAEKSLDLVLELSAKHHWVKGDATRLQQVFWNLIKNAVKFTAPQGRIVLESYNEGEEAFCVKVSDTGIGIEAEILPRIFMAFEQGRSSITRQFGGLGLGLAISKALVEQHHGKLSASSSGRDKGATFVVSIPTTRDPPQANAYHAPRLVHPAPARVIRALLVEDHRDTARVMAKLLRGNGYDVDAAATFTEATNLLKSKPYDVMVSDIGLPDGSGLDLMRHARASQNLVGIALSGFGMEHDIRRSKEAGFSVHLTKPLNFQLLVEAIERLTAAAEEAAAKPAAG